MATFIWRSPFHAIGRIEGSIFTATPTDKDQCKNDGYKNFNPPSGPYKNQGQCVSAANHQ
ncbi:MAG: hypothetical protein ACXW20_15485 [Burkholderiales bacterium]